MLFAAGPGMGFGKTVRSGAQRFERIASGTKRTVKARLNLWEAVEIVPFYGYGTREHLILMGRVSERSGVADLDRDAGFWRNILNSLKRFDSDEIPGALIEAYFQNETWDERCDNDGYFKIEMKPDGGVEPGWHDVDLELIDSMAGDEASAPAKVLVPSPEAEFLVISDIDDTVIETGAMDSLHLLRTLLFHNARQRKPFPGVVSLYRALLLGPDEKGENPIFYLSRSGWPMFDLFDVVFETNDIPRGPLLLRDLQIVEKKSTALGTEAHKLEYVRTLLDLYDLPVVLIGDSGQHDPEIYRTILDENRDRVAGVYIRHVVGGARAREIERLYREHLEKLCIAPSTIEMARHARTSGLISPDQLISVHEGVRKDLERRAS